MHHVGPVRAAERRPLSPWHSSPTGNPHLLAATKFPGDGSETAQAPGEPKPKSGLPTLGWGGSLSVPTLEALFEHYSKQCPWQVTRIINRVDFLY